MLILGALRLGERPLAMEHQCGPVDIRQEPGRPVLFDIPAGSGLVAIGEAEQTIQGGIKAFDIGRKLRYGCPCVSLSSKGWMREACRKFPGWRRILFLLYILVDELKKLRALFCLSVKKMRVCIMLSPRKGGAMALLTILAERVRRQRMALGLTQTEFAAQTGIPIPNLSRIERGRQSLYVERLVVLATALNVTTDYLLGLSNDPAPKRPRSRKSAAVG